MTRVAMVVRLRPVISLPQIKAEQVAAETARAAAAWLAEQELRKQQQTAQAHAQIERDLRIAEERTSKYE